MNKTTKRTRRTRLAVFAATGLAALSLAASRLPGSRAGAAVTAAPKLDFYHKAVPDIDPSLAAGAVRQPTGVQLSAADGLKSAYGPQLNVRWNQFSGTPDAITNFHTAPSADTPENTARAFIGQNSALFGVSADSLALVDQKEALGGYLLRFQQKVNGVDVAGGGLGFLMNSQKQIRLVMGSTFRDVQVSNATALDAAAATAGATQSLAQYAGTPSSAVAQMTKPAFDELEKQVAPALRAPRLNVVPTPDGYRMAWNVITFSRNPFGMFVSQVDAATGEVLARENLVKFQSTDQPLPYTADIYPNHPTLKNPDTGELALDASGEPAGLQRVQLRNYNPGTNATGVNGLMSGPHALIKNVLAAQQPFPQAALGTFHFRQNNAPLEAQPNEADDLAEPSEHIDDVNIFFFINYLLEYVDDIHRRDDTVNNKIGTGSFPDTYPNYDRPLVGLPHFPNDPSGTLGSAPDTTSADTIVKSTLGFDNAFSLPVVETVDTPAGPQKIVVNPTVYGHGYAFNDLGKDGAVCYHEGMHSISTPIAGLEGAPEGGALNEGQADLWAYTITGAEAIGEYVVAGAGIRKEFRDAGRDPDSLAWIRSVHTSLKYSQLGTWGGSSFEVHRDGEIYVGAMWDLRNLMTNAFPQKTGTFVRPSFIDGKPTRVISQGQEMWERDFLGSLYILGLTAPDTFVKARDAMIMADRTLYPSDPTDLDAPGQHEALIWQVFASHELGTNAAAPLGGRQTISTAVPQFALDQARPAAPQGVTLAPGAQLKSVNVAWQPVSGAFAYEVFKRRVGTAGQRQTKGGRYFDGDNQTTGWSHVAYVTGGQTAYEDKGFIAEFFGPAGIKSKNDSAGFNEMFDTEYAVRAVSLNPNRQAGFGDLSAAASLSYSYADVTNSIQAAISNVKFAGSVFEFDQTVRNNGVAGAASTTAFAPVDFQIVGISSPTVTAANADNGGTGQGKPASYVYNQTLQQGATSAARHLAFNDPGAAMFTFDAVVTARVLGATTPANGSQSYDGDGGGQSSNRVTSTTDTYSGVIVVGSGGSQIANGVDYVDVPFVAKAGAFGVQGTLGSTPNGGVAPDLDFQLRDDQGNVLATSGNLGPNESLGASVVPGRTYIYRVVGYASGPALFTITSEQFVNQGAGGTTSGGTTTAASGSGFLPAVTGVSAPTHLVRFTVNPLTGAVGAKVIK